MEYKIEFPVVKAEATALGAQRLRHRRNRAAQNILALNDRITANVPRTALTFAHEDPRSQCETVFVRLRYEALHYFGVITPNMFLDLMDRGQNNVAVAQDDVRMR